MAKSFPELTDSARQMLTGLEANTAEVSKRGVTAEFTKSGKALLASVDAMRAERDTMKAALKAKTAALEIAVAQLKTWNSEASRAVKRTYRDQQEKWVEFGINMKAKGKGKAKK
jgi:hypothetical protein